jgi:hypothetical protein
MKINFLIFIFIVSLGNAIAQKAVKFDTTMKLNKAGYRIRCSNKNADKNNLMIGPIGFENTARDVEFEIKGRINKCELEDFNNDGFPDAVLYIIDANQKGSVIGLSSEKNEGLNPILFPDITDDFKLKTGYNGYDEFSLFQGTLLRRFPIYNGSDSTNNQRTGQYRTIQYRVVPGERGSMKFKILRSFDK